MRKITMRTKDAWLKKKERWHLSNTTVQRVALTTVYKGRLYTIATALTLTLFDNVIAIKLNGGMAKDFYFCMHRWASPTTKERLQAVGLSLNSSQGVLYNTFDDNSVCTVYSASMNKYIEGKNQQIVPIGASPRTFISTTHRTMTNEEIKEKLINGPIDDAMEWYIAAMILDTPIIDGIANIGNTGTCVVNARAYKTYINDPSFFEHIRCLTR